MSFTVFWGSFPPGLGGFEEVTNLDVDIFRMYMPDIAAFNEEHFKPGETVICTGKIEHAGSTYLQQWSYLTSIVPKDRVHECKLTLAVPNWYDLRYKEERAYPKSVYVSGTDYCADIAKAYRAELKILYDAGLRNVWFNDPNLACFCSEAMLKWWKEDEENTYCISERPADMHTGVHLCRGKFVKSRHFSEGGYDRIAVKLFQELNVDTYYQEYDTPRAGGFDPLKHVPKNKNIILGLITSKFPELENVDEMRKKVVRVADLISEGNNETQEEALRRLEVSPQCGFASHPSGNAVV